MALPYFSPGWYCTSGAVQSMPTDPAQGGECVVGEYCPVQSPAPIACTTGHYCGSSRLSAVTGECVPGNFLYH